MKLGRSILGKGGCEIGVYGVCVRVGVRDFVCGILCTGLPKNGLATVENDDCHIRLFSIQRPDQKDEHKKMGMPKSALLLFIPRDQE